MRHTAKLFLNGRSQAIRLPANFRFEGDEVYIRRDPETGDVVISRKPGSWQDYFEMQKSSNAVPDDFMAERDNAEEHERTPF